MAEAIEKLNIFSKENLIKTLVVLVVCAITGVLVNDQYKSVFLFLVGAMIFIGLSLAIFKKPYFGLFLVAFFLPFERLGSFEMGSMTVRISQVFALITLIAFFLVSLAKKKNNYVKNPLIIFVFLFTGVSVLSLANAQNISRSLTILGFNFFVMLVALVIPSLINSKELFKKIVWVILLSGLVVSIYGLFQFVGDMIGIPKEITGLRDIYTSQVFGFPRIQGTSSEPLYFGNFLLIPLGICLAMILSRKRGKQDEIDNGLILGQETKKQKNNKTNRLLNLSAPIVLFVILGLMVLNLVLTVSRGAYLGFAGMLVLFALFYFKSFFSPKRIIIIAAIAIIAIVSTIYLLKFTRKDVNIKNFTAQATEFEEGASIEERYSTYKQAWFLIQRNPILGVGIGGFGPEVAQGPISIPKNGWAIVNNEFLEIWAETGIFGLLIFLAMIFFIFFRTLKVWFKSDDFMDKTLVVGLTVAFAGILIQYMTFSSLYIIHIWFLIGLIIAGQNLALRKFQIPNSKQITKDKLQNRI
ncbi:MAG: O-antigen ligase family protein [Patescibacteria group bacterium]|jgi:O-antigen ligase